MIARYFNAVVACSVRVYRLAVRFIHKVKIAMDIAFLATSSGGLSWQTRRSMVNLMAAQEGMLDIQTIILGLVAIMLVYRVVTQIGQANAEVQAASNVSSSSKWAAGLGEWLFPLLAVVGIVMAFLAKRAVGRRRKGT